MSKPIVADISPKKVTLEAGKDYYFCACGRSATQPFCDGSHQGTGLTPKAFKVDKDSEAYLCRCKQSANQPFCDGSHMKLSAEDVGNEAAPPASERPQAQATKEEPTVAAIHQLAREGLQGSHGEMVAMGVPRHRLPDWDDIQILTAQLATRPLSDDTPISSRTVIGPRAAKPLVLSMPLFVSDMSFGSLSQEAKETLAKGAELAGTGICSGEGGMLDEEQQACSRYLYEMASAQFGYHDDKIKRVQAFHFKGGQAAKTGIGGHLPANKVSEKIAEVRGLKPGQEAISPAAFANLVSVNDFRSFADRVRDLGGGIPVGFKLSANHIEADIDFALQAGADYIILDGRGGGTGAAPQLFRDHISVPTLAALTRARRHLDKRCGRDVSLIITGGLRTAPDFIKAMAMGADAVAIANAAIQSIGCVGARICNTNQCPAGIATQDPKLRQRLDVDNGPAQLARFLTSSTELMKIMARACGHCALNQFTSTDLCSWKKEVCELTGLPFAGIRHW
ncbi:Glutamate synthase domain-containing protein 2 [Ferrimonas sediminum]|uniref:Glutamate synthase domain-containing protein 2 n=1 Tax=Ferrimonas sediminum TaxID=718193 RepID=A0A1G8W5J0_9GAMM|nr:glutamate synthase-related protein [Ferrimonas sediminum]SDJ73559.1 Glutamate synthase domain-containing protein 2 [Ferrimonas sediminum]